MHPKFIYLALVIFSFTNCTTIKKTASPAITKMMKNYTYLALGDSYTIGESVPSSQNFPNQVTGMLREKNYTLMDPVIIAKTGWTTGELQEAIIQKGITSTFDFVTLLIGVNNQYRGYSIQAYQTQFEELLKKAITFAGNNKNHVAVLSIPDWGATPFAQNRDRNKIAKEINEFNLFNKQITEKYGVHYIDITPGSREASIDKTLVASDGLHPSPKEYTRWAKEVTTFFNSQFHP